MTFPNPERPRALFATILGIPLEDLEYADRVLGVPLDGSLTLSRVEQAFAERRQRVGRLAGRIGEDDLAWMYRKLEKAKVVLVEVCRRRPGGFGDAGAAKDPALRPLQIPPPPSSAGDRRSAVPPLRQAYSSPPQFAGSTASPAYEDASPPPRVRTPPSYPRHFGPSAVENFVYLVGVLTIVVAGVALMSNFLPKPIEPPAPINQPPPVPPAPPNPGPQVANLVAESLGKMRIGNFEEARHLANEAMKFEPENQIAKALRYLAAYVERYEPLADTAFAGLPRGAEVDLGKGYGLAEFIQRDGDSWTFMCRGRHRNFTTAQLKDVARRFRITERWVHEFGTPADQLTLGAFHLVKRLKAHGTMVQEQNGQPCDECVEAAKTRWDRVMESPDASPEDKEAARMLLTLGSESG
jgi:hypothetical protein